MTPADLALDNAIHFEGVKHAYRQTRDGVVISFVVHPHDIPKGLAEAPLGSRYIVAMVQVGDDEQPVHQPVKEIKPLSEKEPATPQPPSPLAAAKRDWSDIPPAAQASMLCDRPVFQAFLREKYPEEWHESMTDPDECVRLICSVSSKSMLNDGAPRVIWHQLQTEYQAWEIVGE